MNTRTFESAGKVYSHSEYILGYSFKIDAPRGQSAIFDCATNNSVSRHITFKLSDEQDSCVYFDHVSRLSPSIISMA